MIKPNELTNKEYNFIYSKVPRICIDLIIEKENKILLIKREIQPYKNCWHLPGGRILFRESIKNAINRISLNEIGSLVESYKFVNVVGEFLREYQNGEKRHSISIVYYTKLKSPAINGKYFDILPKKIELPHKIILNKFWSDKC